jgi:hypothetical protein
MKNPKKIKKYLFVKFGMWPDLKSLHSLSQLKDSEKWSIKHGYAALFKSNDELEIVRIGINGKKK